MSEQDTPKMVERVARAICVARGHNPDGPTCDVFIPGDPDACMPWAGFRKEARAAIEAMREPIPVVMDEAPIRRGIGIGSFTAAEAWRAMIDAALEPRR